MSEFTSLSDIITIFYNSAQPTFVRCHIITLYIALVAPKQSIVIRLSFATTIACTLLWLPQSKVRFYPTFFRYHHRLLSCSGCPKAKCRSIFLSLASQWIPTALHFYTTALFFNHRIPTDMLPCPIESILGDINFQKTMLVSTNFNTLSGGRDHTSFWPSFL